MADTPTEDSKAYRLVDAEAYPDGSGAVGTFIGPTGDVIISHAESPSKKKYSGPEPILSPYTD